ncbi:MAG: galactokinase [Bacteroidetes bacterium]|nr:galactokinase [Bacteroidota bacterium]
MKQEILQLKTVFSKIYGEDGNILEAQYTRYDELVRIYQEKFGKQELHYFSTPGRTEIGGNHTDHNHGRVLAGSINLDSVAIAAKSQSDQITVYSVGYDEPFLLSLGDLDVNESEFGTTTSLIRGIASRLKQLGYQIGGFNACITSDVLPGSGLSSSASIEVLIGNIFSSLFNNDGIDQETLALTGQYSENHYFGKPCGLMDQVACAMGGMVTIDFKDPQNPQIKRVDFDFDAQDHSLIVVDTGGTHADLTDDYAAVPTEMKSVAEALGGKVCRDIELEDLMAGIGGLRTEQGDRALLRALHFMGDNQRVVDQVQALENNDFKRFLQMITESGNSSYKRLQNIISPSNTREQGVALALALTENYLALINAGACRVHGGGFAGTIQIFLPNSAIQDYVTLMEKVFGAGSVHVLRIRPLGTLHLNPFFGQD